MVSEEVHAEEVITEEKGIAGEEVIAEEKKEETTEEKMIAEENKQTTDNKEETTTEKELNPDNKLNFQPEDYTFDPDRCIFCGFISDSTDA